MKLVVDDPVERSDGRFYVPISTRNGGQILTRVSTDHFDTLNEAINFAEDLAYRYNHFEDNG